MGMVPLFGRFGSNRLFPSPAKPDAGVAGRARTDLSVPAGNTTNCEKMPPTAMVSKARDANLFPLLLKIFM